MPPAPTPERPASRALLALTAVAPAALLIACDCIRRRDLLAYRAGPSVAGYVLGALLSVALWAFALEAARHPRWPVRVAATALLALTAAFGVGAQMLFHATAHELFNRDAVIFSLGMWPILVDYLLQSPALYLGALLGAAALAVAYALLRHRLFGPRRRYATPSAVLALAACLLSAFLPFLGAPAAKRGLPPDVLFWHAAGGVGLRALGLIERPRTLPPGRHAALPPSTEPVAADAPDIVFIFGESVRRDEVCAERSDGCTKSPGLDAAAPGRVGFKRSFAVASCTEVSSAILWSGLSIASASETLQEAPLVWDYAKARGYRTAYLTSQNLSFQDQGTFLRTSRIDEKREARDRTAHPDMDLGTPDEDSAAEALAFLAKGGGPAFAVLHLSNTHVPYRQVPGYTPRSMKAEHVDAFSLADAVMGARRARYLNSLTFQDATIGHFVAKLRETERGKRAIVVYTADHGEAWGEHGSFTHSFDLYGEQIDVPLWIDAPEGTLSAAQRDELRAAAAARPVFTADVTATLLDLLGALDGPGLDALAGVSVLRQAPATRDLELSNCTPFRGCSPESWGMVRWPRKYHYAGRALQSLCFDLEADPLERAPLPAGACRDLEDLVARHHRAGPAGSPATKSP